MAGRIGAEVRGVALDAAIDDATLAALQAAIARHKVLFFRRQHGVGDVEQEMLAARFGEPVAHPTLDVVEGSRFLLELESTDGHAPSSWHTDLTFLAAHPQIFILRGVVIPPVGGVLRRAAAQESLPAGIDGTVSRLIKPEQAATTGVGEGSWS